MPHSGNRLTPEEAQAEIDAMQCDDNGVPQPREGETFDQMMERIGREQDEEDRQTRTC